MGGLKTLRVPPLCPGPPGTEDQQQDHKSSGDADGGPQQDDGGADLGNGQIVVEVPQSHNKAPGAHRGVGVEHQQAQPHRQPAQDQPGVLFGQQQGQTQDHQGRADDGHDGPQRRHPQKKQDGPQHLQAQPQLLGAGEAPAPLGHIDHLGLRRLRGFGPLPLPHQLVHVGMTEPNKPTSKNQKYFKV